MASNSGKKRSSTANEDYYKLLGVSRSATDAEIKQAYRKLALQLHPDKNTDPEATVRFQAIAKAHKILADPKLRSTYDFLGAQAADLIDQYEDHPGVGRESSVCNKIIFVLVCCLTGCCCCCVCCGCCCGCNFCCDRCCNHCCGKWAHPDASTQSEEEGTIYHTQQTHSIHQQPRDTAADTTKF